MLEKQMGPESFRKVSLSRICQYLITEDLMHFLLLLLIHELFI